MTTSTLVPGSLVPGVSKLYQTGAGVISGTTMIDGVPAKCRVRLEYYNEPIDIIESSIAGEYTFTGLLAGPWRLIVESLDGTRRGKIEIIDLA